MVTATSSLVMRISSGSSTPTESYRVDDVRGSWTRRRSWRRWMGLSSRRIPWGSVAGAGLLPEPAEPGSGSRVTYRFDPTPGRGSDGNGFLAAGHAPALGAFRSEKHT